MSRDATRRRGRLVPHDWGASGVLADVAIVPGPHVDRDTDDRLREENDRLRRQAAEVEGRFRLLCRDRESIRADRDRTAARATELQAELNRLADEHEGLRAHVDRLESDPCDFDLTRMEGAPRMNRFTNLLGLIRRNKAASVAVLSVGALLARDPAVSGAARSVADAAASAVSRGVEQGDDGYVRYARMVAATAEYEAARRSYNAGAETLAGDALLEAQDDLRAAKLRDREARLAFLPELTRRCNDAGVPVPEADAVALADLKAGLSR